MSFPTVIREEFLKFGGNEIGKKNFYSSKSAIAIGNVDIKKITKQKYKKVMLRFFPGYIDEKKLEHYPSNSQKWMGMSIVSKKPGTYLLKPKKMNY